MENYTQLAMRYLKMNRKRSRITVLGCAIAVMILYSVLNLFWSYVLFQRAEIRKDENYEVVFLTQTKEQIDAIVADKRIRDVALEGYYDYDYEESRVYDKAAYVNFVNPYHMGKVADDISRTLQVDYVYNSELASTYLQGGGDYLGVMAICLVLLFSLVFAIFGVGVIRNSIQLSTLEQLRDFGNLRCIGTSKGELKRIIYLEGAILETAGMAVGIVLGTIASMLCGKMFGVATGFHLLPTIPVLIMFYGDLYFAMGENCRVVANMSPVQAIRGEYRIHKEKIKLRHSGMIGKIFGVEGDYAYKNLMRNPGRFQRATWAIGIGIAAFITIMGIVDVVRQMKVESDKFFAFYQVYVDAVELTPERTAEEIRAALPPKLLEVMDDYDEVTKATQVYTADVLLANPDEVRSHYSERYLRDTWYGQLLSPDRESEDIQIKHMDWESRTEISCVGYDREDIERCGAYLVDGTLDVSERGIILLNCGQFMTDEEDGYLMPASLAMEIAEYEIGNKKENVDLEITEYRVGDTVEIVDMAKYRQMYQERLQPLYEEYREYIEKTKRISQREMLGDDGGVAFEEDETELLADEEAAAVMEFRSRRMELGMECYNELVAAGAYNTYTIEGIVERDANRSGTGRMEFILPMENYYALTGTDKSMSVGMQYHFDKFPVLAFENSEWWYYAHQTGGLDKFGDYLDLDYSLYPWFRSTLYSMRRAIISVAFFVFFVVMVSCLNIFNTTASNIHLRSRELAQLRVIGVSRKGLMKMVMLEGVFSSIVANIIGITIGSLLSFYIYKMVISVLTGYAFRFPLKAAVVGAVISTLVLCGSVYMPLRDLRDDIGNELKTAGD